MIRTFRAALALAGVFSVLACASQPRPPGPGGEGMQAAGFSGGLIATPIGLVMTDFDADRDRATTRAELDAGLDALWSGVDADADGEASALEFADWALAAMGSETAIPGRMAFDRDASGTISRAEFAVGLDAEFARLDANGDGAVERAELVRLVAPGGMGPGDGPRAFSLRRGGPGGAGGPGGPSGGPSGGSGQAAPAGGVPGGAAEASADAAG